ncbi:MAG: DAK2 domain-containing protein [Clostridia bacterium]|nr:DAK2 domain-containing protein [Clostridia bacterium]
MTKQELIERLKGACASVKAAQDELTEIDSKFGDADHGITMTKIADTIEKAAVAADGSIKSLLDDVAMAVMMINGGSAVPLWNTWLDGLQEGAPDADSMDIVEIKAMFAHALETLAALSKAKVGDKTMMDALIPASEAIAACDGDEDAIFQAAAAAAKEGAENSKNFVSKFGRARSYGEATIGTPDAGAVSMMYFFAGLAI